MTYPLEALLACLTTARIRSSLLIQFQTNLGIPAPMRVSCARGAQEVSYPRCVIQVRPFTAAIGKRANYRQDLTSRVFALW